MKFLKKYEKYSIDELKDRFKIGEYAIMKAFDKRVKIVSVTDYDTLWVEDDTGHWSEWKPNGIIPEIEFQSNKYNL